MERYSEVLGLPVICVDNGEKLGTVKDVVFCPAIKKVAGFLVERKGYRTRKKVVLLKDVRQLGKDAIVINNSSCAADLKKVENHEEIAGRRNIIGLRVYSKSGNDMGIVKDVLFDYTTGVIEGIEVSDGLLQDIMEGRNILPLFGKVEFGEENILVDKEAVEEMLAKGGGIRKRLFKDQSIK